MGYPSLADGINQLYRNTRLLTVGKPDYRRRSCMVRLYKVDFKFLAVVAQAHGATHRTTWRR